MRRERVKICPAVIASESLGKGEQSGVTMRPFKMQMIGQQSIIFVFTRSD
jgi:hypothetical protein